MSGVNYFFVALLVVFYSVSLHQILKFLFVLILGGHYIAFLVCPFENSSIDAFVGLVIVFYLFDVQRLVLYAILYFCFSII